MFEGIWKRDKPTEQYKNNTTADLNNCQLFNKVQ